MMKRSLVFGVAVAVFALAISVQAYAKMAGPSDYQGSTIPFDHESAVIDVNSDYDGDGVVYGDDNCPNDPNPYQEDLDGDLKGDVCDVDIDGDGIDNDEDNCELVDNSDQVDLDDDGIGDACDSDVTIEDDDDDSGDSGDSVDSGDFFDGFDQSGSGIDYLGNGVDRVNTDEGVGCSIAPAAAVNPVIFLIISAGLLPLAIWRKE